MDYQLTAIYHKGQAKMSQEFEAYVGAAGPVRVDRGEEERSR